MPNTTLTRGLTNGQSLTGPIHCQYVLLKSFRINLKLVTRTKDELSYLGNHETAKSSIISASQASHNFNMRFLQGKKWLK